jgi:hypothetical protein
MEVYLYVTIVLSYINYGNINLKISTNISSFKSHGRVHDKLFKKGSLSFKNLNDDIITVKLLVNDKSIFAINKKSLETLKTEFKITKHIKEYSSKYIPGNYVNI